DLSGRAVAADQLPLLGFGELTAVVHEEAPGTGELVRLTGQNANAQLLVGQVRTRKLEALGQFGLVFHGHRGLLPAPCLQLLDAVLVDLLVGLAGRIVVCSHISCSPQVSSETPARWVYRMTARVCARPAHRLCTISALQHSRVSNVG